MKHPSLLDSSPGSDAAAISMVPIHVQHASLKPMVLGMSAQHCTGKSPHVNRAQSTVLSTARQQYTYDGGLSGRSLMNHVLFNTVLLLLLLAASDAPSLLPPSLLLRCPLSVVSSAVRRGINACTCTSTPSCAPCCQDCCRHVCRIQHKRHTVHAHVSSMAMRICDRRGLLPVASQVLS